MKFLLKILIFLIAIPYLLHGQDFCGSLCEVVLDTDTGKPRGDLNCTLSNQNATIPITAIDVFESDGTTLKKYFGQNQTVCDVLGWMGDGVSSLSKSLFVRIYSWWRFVTILEYTMLEKHKRSQ